MDVDSWSYFYFNLYVSITFKIEVYINTHEASLLGPYQSIIWAATWFCNEKLSERVQRLVNVTDKNKIRLFLYLLILWLVF